MNLNFVNYLYLFKLLLIKINHIYRWIQIGSYLFFANELFICKYSHVMIFFLS